MKNLIIAAIVAFLLTACATQELSELRLSESERIRQEQLSRQAATATYDRVNHSAPGMIAF